MEVLLTTMSCRSTADVSVARERAAARLPVARTATLRPQLRRSERQ